MIAEPPKAPCTSTYAAKSWSELSPGTRVGGKKNRRAIEVCGQCIGGIFKEREINGKLNKSNLTLVSTMAMYNTSTIDDRHEKLLQIPFS